MPTNRQLLTVLGVVVLWSTAACSQRQAGIDVNIEADVEATSDTTAEASVETTTDVVDRHAEPGTLIRVEIEPCAGLGLQRATALAIGNDAALTAAHSFESAKSAVLRFTDASGRETTVDASLSASDADKDIAVIKPTAPLEQPWQAFVLGEPSIGESVTVETYADVDGPQTKPAEVLRLVNATLDGEGRRAAIELDADIEPGDSGAPVLNADNHAVGMVFASSRNSNRGWAIRSSELAELVDRIDSADPVDEFDSASGFDCSTPDGGEDDDQTQD